MEIKSLLPEIDLKNRWALVRADLNVPLSENTITNDFRLRSAQPTLDYILKKGANIVLITHIGRPSQATASLSTKRLLPWFQEHGYTVEFCPDLVTLHQKMNQSLAPARILLLENLRFFPGEKARDTHFAQQLAYGCDVYVNDAFGALHRSDASITLTPHYFDENKKTIGLLVEKELAVLSTLQRNPARPYVLIMGGGKIKDKIELIEYCLDKVDAILLCPALVFTFMAARGIPVGHSLIDASLIAQCRAIEKKAQEHHVQLVLPVDFQIASVPAANTDQQFVDVQAIDENKLAYCAWNHIPDHAVGITIGPQTIARWAPIISGAKTIFFNAAMGWPEKPMTRQSTHEILQAMAQSTAYTIVGGGDSVQAAFDFKVADQINFLSTGGGATLAYISGKELPGLKALGL